jgi:hypothetical protein
MALGSRYLVGKDCHWIGVTWMTREAWVEGVDWSCAAEVDVVDWGFNTYSMEENWFGNTQWSFYDLVQRIRQVFN